MRKTCQKPVFAEFLLDYAALVDADSFEPVDFLRGNCLLLIAARIGSTRLIDNMLVEEHAGNFAVSL